VVGEAADAEEVVRLAQQLKPDVVLMDIDLPGLDSLEAIRRVKASLPATKIIMLSAVDGETYSKAAEKSGADIFLSKSAPISEILSVIRHGRSAKAAPGNH
jgi:DNA-binding NarL/FixJ family response regulator